jgi:hypothetical protein
MQKYSTTVFEKCSICLVCSVPDVTFTSFQMFDMLYPASSSQPPPQLHLAFPLHVGDGLSGDLLVCVTATFIMLHFFLFSTSGSFFALHLLVPESPSFTSKSLTIVSFKKKC